jgi:hypothetical protein
MFYYLKIGSTMIIIITTIMTMAYFYQSYELNKKCNNPIFA